MITSLFLYCLLGVALAASGVGVLEKPWQFFCIMAVVAFIELNSRYSL